MHTLYMVSVGPLGIHIISHYYRNELGTSGYEAQKSLEERDFPIIGSFYASKFSSALTLSLVVTKPTPCPSHQALYICRANDGVSASLLILCHLCYWSVGRCNFRNTPRDSERCSRINSTAAL